MGNQPQGLLLGPPYFWKVRAARCRVEHEAPGSPIGLRAELGDVPEARWSVCSREVRERMVEPVRVQVVGS